MNGQAELQELLSLSSRLGRNPLLVQASSGNTSLKLDDALWIKASGKWLANALEQSTLVPVSLSTLRLDQNFTGLGAWVGTDFLRASIETAMHAVLPHKVVLHVHSVNTIAWAVREDGPERIAERLNGLRWAWIPYVPSGLPLAGMVESAPDADIFILANHGLVVCGESCEAADHLLKTVESKLAIQPREGEGLDEIGRRILQGGVLYPCQAIFLGPNAERSRDQDLTVTQRAVWNGLVEVLRRLDEHSPLRYLTTQEVTDLLTEDSYNYQLCTEKNAAAS